jgi:predicted aspartyl protease
LLINNKDAQSLGWLPKMTSRRVRTAAGITLFNLYEGIVVLDDEEFTIPVLGGDKIKEILLGVRWLQFRRLIADFSAEILTLD